MCAEASQALGGFQGSSESQQKWVFGFHRVKLGEMPAWNLSCCRLTFWRLWGDVLTSSVPATLGVAPRPPVSESLLGAGGETLGICGQGPNGVRVCPHSVGNAEIREESRAHSLLGSWKKHWSRQVLLSQSLLGVGDSEGDRTPHTSWLSQNPN